MGSSAPYKNCKWQPFRLKSLTIAKLSVLKKWFQSKVKSSRGFGESLNLYYYYYSWTRSIVFCTERDVNVDSVLDGLSFVWFLKIDTAVEFFSFTFVNSPSRLPSTTIIFERRQTSLWLYLQSGRLSKKSWSCEVLAVFILMDEKPKWARILLSVISSLFITHFWVFLSSHTFLLCPSLAPPEPPITTTSFMTDTTGNWTLSGEREQERKE